MISFWRHWRQLIFWSISSLVRESAFSLGGNNGNLRNPSRSGTTISRIGFLTDTFIISKLMICSNLQSLSLEASWALGSFLEGWIWLVPWSAFWTFWFHPAASPWRCQPHHYWPGRIQSTAWKRMSERQNERERGVRYYFAFIWPYWFLSMGKSLRWESSFQGPCPCFSIGSVSRVIFIQTKGIKYPW